MAKKHTIERAPLVPFGLVGALSLTVGWRPLIDTFSLAWQNDQYTHILLILPVAVTLICVDWQTPSRRQEVDSPLGLIFLGLAGLTAGLSILESAFLAVDLRLSLSMLALVIWWVGAFILCFGVRVARSRLFPLCLLLGLVPIPQLTLAEIINGLQQGSAFAAQVLFATIGIPVVQQGVTLTIPGLTIEVAQDCSSIRSSSMLLITTMVLAHLVLRSPWRKALAIAIAVPLSVAKNGLRIFTIAMLGTRVDPAYLNGRLHHQGGIVFFTISLAAVGLLLWRLRNGEAHGLVCPPAAQRATPIGD
jgi:exosortase